MTKIIIIIGSLLLSGAYLSVGHLLRTEVQDITQKIESAIAHARHFVIALNNWKENCIIAGKERNLSVCGEKIDLRVARIDNEVEIIYQGGFPDEPNVMIITSNFNLGRYCIVLDGIIRWGTYTVDGCNQIIETD